MSNPEPSYRQSAKYPGRDGKATKTKTLRVPIYLIEEVEAIAQEMHKRRTEEGTVPGAGEE